MTPNKSSSVFKYSETELANHNSDTDEPEYQDDSDDEVPDFEVDEL